MAATTLLGQSNAPAGLVRISHKQAGADSYIFDDSAGASISVYIVDTGILASHTVSS